MTMLGPLDGLQEVEYLKQFGDIYKRLSSVWNPSWSTRNNGKGTIPTSGMRTG